MTIDFDGSEGLYTRLGKVGNVINVVNTFRGTTIVGDMDELGDVYASNPELATTFVSDLQSIQSGPSGALTDLRTRSEQTVIQMVKADNRQPDDSLTTALVELIRQMDDNTESLDANTVSATATPDAENNGDGVVCVSVKNGRGQTLQMALAENVILSCLSDSQGNAGAAGIETFQGKGEQPETDLLSWNWPQGSGCQVSLSAIPATADNQNQNLLVNGDFEAFTGNAPDNWSVIAGSPGTEIDDEASIVYAGSKALVLHDGTNARIAQVFNDGTTGTGATLQPNTVYHGCFWSKVDSAAASGSISVRLWDTTNSAVMADDQTTSNSTTINLTSLTTSYVAQTFTFITPRTLPAAYRFEILATSIPASRDVFIDHLTFAAATELYASGPYVTLHSGATAFSREDFFTVAVSNNYAGGFLSLLQRLFDTNGKRLQFPVDGGGSETILDSLIA